MQLCTDRNFREALETQIEMERIIDGRPPHPASMLELALMEIDGRSGIDLAGAIAGIDLSVAGRGGAIRVPHYLWERAVQISLALRRTTGYPPPVRWSPRVTIISALYCYAARC